MAAKKTDIKEFGVIVIESLRDGDTKTGELLYNEIIKYKKFEEPNLSASLVKIETKKELFSQLEEIISKVKDEGLFPFLHLEIHGWENGIQLRSGEKVRWDEIHPYLRKINIHLKNYLVVMLAVCEGSNIIIHLDPDDRAPFRAVVGTFRKISEGEIISAFEAYYNHYFFSMDYEEAVRQMNLAISQNERIFYVTKSEDFLKRMLDPDRDPEHFRKLVQEEAEFSKLTVPAYHDLPLNTIKLITEENLRAMMKEALNKKEYFMMKYLKEE